MYVVLGISNYFLFLCRIKSFTNAKYKRSHKNFEEIQS